MRIASSMPGIGKGIAAVAANTLPRASSTAMPASLTGATLAPNGEVCAAKPDCMAMASSKLRRYWPSTWSASLSAMPSDRLVM